MKNIIIILLLFLFKIHANAGCSSPITRTNFTANQVLGSTRLNTELNTAYTKINELDGDCLTDATLEYRALSASGFDPVKKGIKEGCFVSRSSVAIITVSKCLLSVNGNLVSTTSANTVTMGCVGCSAEVVSTVYYVYAKTGSSGTTLNLNISTVAPNEDGYNAGGDRVLARFYNDAGSDIDQYSIDQWIVNKFRPQQTGWIAYTPTGSWVTNTTYAGYFRRVGSSIEINAVVSTSGAPNSTSLYVAIPSAIVIDTAKTTVTGHAGFGHVLVADGGGSVYKGHVQAAYLTGAFYLAAENAAGTYSVSTLITQAIPITFGASDTVTMHVTAPIVGWND